MPSGLHSGPLDAQNVEWCPTMDLLAVVTGAGGVVVYRAIEFHKLVAASVDELGARALCGAWRPDGRAIALGLENGRVALLELEGGVTLLPPAGEAPVTAMHWTRQTGGEEELRDGAPYPDRACDLLPTPLPGTAASSTFSSAAAQEAAREASVFRPPPLLELLVAATACGELTVFCYGRFPCARVQLGGGEGGVVSVSEVCLAPDLRLLQARLVMTDGGSAVAAVDCSGLWRSRRELGALAVHSLNASLLLDVFAESLDKAGSDWTSGVKKIRMKFDLLDGTLRDHGSESEPREELRSAVTCGLTSPAASHFLSNYVAVQSVQRLHGELSAACVSVGRLVGGPLMQAAQGVLFRASDMRGMARCRQFAALGLTVELAARAVAAADALLRKVSEAAVVARRAQHDLLNLLNWVCTVNARDEPNRRPPRLLFPELDLPRLGAFLGRPLPPGVTGAGAEIVSSTYVAEYWAAESLSDAAVASFGGDDDGGGGGGGGEGSARSVRQQLLLLREAWSAVAMAPLSGTAQPLLRPLSLVRLPTPPPPMQCPRTTAFRDGRLLSALCPPGGSVVWLLAAQTRGKRRGAWTAAALAIEGVVDVALYAEVEGAPFPNEPRLLALTGEGELLIVDIDEVDMAPFSPPFEPGSLAPQEAAVEARHPLGELKPTAVAACGPRGLACVVGEPSMVHIVDVENDPDSDSEEEEEEEED